MLARYRIPRLFSLLFIATAVITALCFFFLSSNFIFNLDPLYAPVKTVNKQVITFYKPYKHLIPKTLISPEINLRRTELLILISSSPYNYGRRNAIRNSWADCDNLHGQYYESKLIPKEITCMRVFMVGRMASNETTLIHEAETYNDMIIVDYLDTYKTITFKLLSAFKWAYDIFPNYVLKSDDDVFVHLPRLILQVLSSAKKRFYGGVPYSGGKVMRNINHKHFVSYKDFNEPKFPTFCRGGMYVFSGDLLPEVLNASNEIPIFGVDDAFLGIIMRNIGVSPQHIKKFAYVELKGFLDYMSDCFLSSTIGLGDGLTEYQILDIHNRIKLIDSSLISQLSCFQLAAQLFYIILILIVSFIVYFLLFKYLL